MAKKNKKSTLYYKVSRRILGLFMITATLALWLALCYYNPSDRSFNVTGDQIYNKLGVFGSYSADFIMRFVGIALVFYLIAFCVWGYRFCLLQPISYFWLRLLSWICGLVASSLFLSKFNSGGILGHVLSQKIIEYVPPFTYRNNVILGASVIIGFSALNFSVGLSFKFWIDCLVKICVLTWLMIKKFWRFLKIAANKLRHTKFRKTDKKQKIEPVFGDIDDKNQSGIIETPRLKETKESPIKNKTQKKKDDTPKVSEKNNYLYPPIDLLSKPQNKNSSFVSEKDLEAIAHKLESVLQEFSVNGKIVKIRPGPVVTLYELEPAPGTKTARVIGLSDDIARSMSAVSVRIAVVSGKNTIGIELPNQTRETVWLRDLLEGEKFTDTKNILNVVLGKDIGGENTYADLTQMPHLLVAGTTGSGKSVGVNSMILSLLYRMHPDECKLIMIDPKMLEFSIYNGIPHLLTPVITDASKAVIGLKWAVAEMERRYKAMAQLNVRNISGYNTRLDEMRKSGEKHTRTIQTGFDTETGALIFEEQEIDLTPLPYIVIIVDEMADLMLVAGKEVEAAIQRLAQLARAAGIHLILATQRPSVDVITGIIKANFPTRISFQVTSKVDSRTILDEQGAEQLLGKGDMLYRPAGKKPVRIHGSFVDDKEVEAVVEFLKTQGTPQYIENITEGELVKESGSVFDRTSMGGLSGGSDEDLYNQAVEIVRNDKKTSISYVQRRLRIGYNRAASLIERMEDEGIISPADHSGKRTVIE